MSSPENRRAHVNLGDAAPHQIPPHEASEMVQAAFYAKLKECRSQPEQPAVHLDNGIRLLDKEIMLAASTRAPQPTEYLPEINEWYIDAKGVHRERHYLFSDEHKLCLIVGGSIKIIDPTKPKPYTIHRAQATIEEVSSEHCLDLLGKIIAGKNLGDVTVAEWAKHWLGTLESAPVTQRLNTRSNYSI